MKVWTILALAALGASSQAILFVDLVEDGGTGTENGGQLPALIPDFNWSYSGPESFILTVPSAQIQSNWLDYTVDNKSMWLSAFNSKQGPNGTEYFIDNNADSGNYVFSLTIALADDFDPKQQVALIEGRFLSDDVATWTINSATGSNSATSNREKTWTPFHLTALNPGENTLVFSLNNAGNALGLRVEFTKAEITSIPAPAVPEPITLGLAAMGLGAAVIRRRRR